MCIRDRLILVVVGFQSIFTVDETEVAIVTTFGEFKSSYTDPGLKTKVPFIDSVTKFDKRLQRVDVPPETILTEDKKRIRVDAYARYKIINPLLFFKNLTNETTADSRIGSIVASRLREEIAQDTQDEVISEKREFVMKAVTNTSNLFEISESEALSMDSGLQSPDLSFFSKSPSDNSFSPVTSDTKAAILNNTLDASIELKYFIPLQDVWGVEIIDVRIKDSNKAINDVSAPFNRLQEIDYRLNRLQAKDPSISLEELYANQPNVLSLIEKYQKEATEIGISLSTFRNRSIFFSVPLSPTIPDDKEAAAFIENIARKADFPLKD